MYYLNDKNVVKQTFQIEKLAYNLQYYLEQFKSQKKITGLQTILIFF